VTVKEFLYFHHFPARVTLLVISREREACAARSGRATLKRRNLCEQCLYLCLEIRERLRLRRSGERERER